MDEQPPARELGASWARPALGVSIAPPSSSSATGMIAMPAVLRRRLRHAATTKNATTNSDERVHDLVEAEVGSVPHAGPANRKRRSSGAPGPTVAAIRPPLISLSLVNEHAERRTWPSRRRRRSARPTSTRSRSSRHALLLGATECSRQFALDLAATRGRIAPQTDRAERASAPRAHRRQSRRTICWRASDGECQARSSQRQGPRTGTGSSGRRRR